MQGLEIVPTVKNDYMKFIGGEEVLEEKEKKEVNLIPNRKFLHLTCHSK